MRSRFLFSFKNKLSTIYFAYTFFVSLAIIMFFFIHISKLLEANSSSLLEQTSEKIHFKLNYILTDMNATTLQAISNSDLQNIMEKCSTYSGTYNYFYFDYTDKNKMTNILASINTPLLNNARISVFDQAQNFLTVGYLETSSDAFYNNFDHYQSLTELSRDSIQYRIYPPHEDFWAEREPRTVVFSFIRIIPNIYNSKEVLGYVEVEQPYTLLENTCSIATSDEISVVILDQNDQVIYPYESLLDEEIRNYAGIKKLPEKQGSYNGAENICYYKQTLEQYGWTILLIQKSSVFYKPVRLLFVLLILFFILFNIFSFFIIYKMTVHLTMPIAKLRKSVEAVSDVNPYIQLNQTTNNEIVMLSNAINDTIRDLKRSMDENIISSKKQAQAQMLALQAQMNPHFLFNTLMLISGLAEEQDNTEIVFICNTLSSMLRYVTAYKENEVPLKNELNYAKNYLDLMKIRYEDHLVFTIDSDDRAANILVPKLILQPLIENSFKHGFKSIAPPYKIQVKISFSKDSLEIVIHDNGVGFCESYIDEFNRQTQKLPSNEAVSHYLQDSELGGLGILNISLRLHMYFGNQASVQIGNAPGGGAFVKIVILSQITTVK